MTYYSKRNKPFSYKISDEFWRAFKAYIKEIGTERGWFPYYSKLERAIDGEYWDVDSYELNLKMTQEIGKGLYPLNKKPADETILDLIEFFYGIVEIPPDNQRDARYLYTIEINKLFTRFRLKYKLEKGKVKDAHSEVLSELISQIDFEIPDKDTQEMLAIALKKFYSREIEEQKIGLEKLVDVYQRISSWENGDKKKSIEKIMVKVSQGDKQVRDFLKKDGEELWEIANKFMIRHTEVDKIPIRDKDVLEYLFYAYFNVIRFILKEYGYLKEKN